MPIHFSTQENLFSLKVRFFKNLKLLKSHFDNYYLERKFGKSKSLGRTQVLTSNIQSMKLFFLKKKSYYSNPSFILRSSDKEDIKLEADRSTEPTVLLL